MCIEKIVDEVVEAAASRDQCTMMPAIKLRRHARCALSCQFVGQNHRDLTRRHRQNPIAGHHGVAVYGKTFTDDLDYQPDGWASSAPSRACETLDRIHCRIGDEFWIRFTARCAQPSAALLTHAVAPDGDTADKVFLCATHAATISL